MSDFIKKRMRLIKRLIETYRRGAPLDDLLAAVTQGLVDEFEAAFARLWLVERQADGREALILKASSGLYTNLQGSRSWIPLPDASKLGQIIASRRGHFTNDTYHDPGVLDKSWAKTNGLVSLAGYPLIPLDQDDAPPFGVLLHRLPPQSMRSWTCPWLRLSTLLCPTVVLQRRRGRRSMRNH